MPIFDIYDDKGNRRITVDARRITLGRTADNAVPIDDRQTSRCHCEVRQNAAGYVLSDLKSRNGTRLNQDIIDRPVVLRDGDEIGIGRATIRFWSSARAVDQSAPDLDQVPAQAPDRQVPAADTNAEVSAGSPPAPQAKEKTAVTRRKKAVQEDNSPVRLVETEETPEVKRPTRSSALHPAYAKRTPVDSLQLNEIMPLTHEGRPAHPVGKDASEVSQAMLRLKQLLLRGLQLQATDIHIEPKEQALAVRYRIDGYLHQLGTLDFKIAKAMYSIVKLLCNLDINKKSVMLDGSFAVQLPDRRVDLRISIAPSTLGDKMVVRILDKNLAPRGLASLGMEPYILEQVRERASKESSMLVVCGPTGSGKTTTVYAVLREMNSYNRNIVTVEDPVEYKLENLTQIQVDQRHNITFASALTSLLRQDPDVILVGEIRDPQTARMAVQSAMTGHLVLSTVHARDSIGCIFRLLDLEVEPFLLGSALTAVLSQRLLRKLCSHCKMVFRPAMKVLARMGLEELGGLDLYSSVGCEKCMGIGHKGRAAVFELMSVNDQVRDAIVNRPTIQQLRVAAGDWIFQTLRQDGIRKLRSELVSLEEFQSVLGKA